MLAASIAALYLNLPLCDVWSFTIGRQWWRNRTHAGSVDRVLLIDDSLNSGGAMARAAISLSASLRVCRIAVYGRSTSIAEGRADLVLEAIDGPRLFEWNLWKHRALQTAMVDIDGVLCRDPTPEENDDGPRYRKFLKTVEPLYHPHRPLGWIATTRLEKYRELTEAWLARQGIRYGGLSMLNLPDAATRRRQGGRAEFKAAVYQERGALFIESDSRQAARIASLSSKAVIAMDTRELFG